MCICLPKKKFPIFIGLLLIEGKHWEVPKHPTTVARMNIHTTAYYTIMKKNSVQLFTPIQMTLTVILLSNRSQISKNMDTTWQCTKRHSNGFFFRSSDWKRPYRGILILALSPGFMDAFNLWIFIEFMTCTFVNLYYISMKMNK